MCSRSPEDLTLPKSDKSISDNCRKCSEKASVVLQAKFSYCRECFMEYFKHKFRATLGKTKIMKHGDKILVGFSGSASSLCLIDLIADSLKDGKKKKMMFEVNILFINERAAYPSNKEIKLCDLNDVNDILKSYTNFKLYSTDLGAYLVDNINLDCDNLYEDASKVNEIQEIFSNFKTLTSKEDLLIKIRNNILFKVAHKMGCQKIFVAETSDHLAVNTIANIAQGRGGQLSLDIGFCNDRSSDLLLLRPLQDCSRKEITYYNLFNHLNPTTSVSFSTKGDKYSSIQKLSEAFITDLQSTFPSTVLTVHATGSKLSSAKSDEGNSECCLCQGKIDERKLSLTADQASLISSLVSNLGPDKFDSKTLTPMKQELANISCKTSCLNNSCECINSDGIDFNINLLLASLCYGCQLILKDSKSIEQLPNNFLKQLQQNAQFNRMHEEIKTFLL
ncbi:hypothetical protein O3M35_002792 [Rhynocoris fuscipes]|uniref:Cytoplasmic tRNA 2-thiolation protein 2 n=1 Tax=Rhynocoris fuscipes TaxID=488301 RepID=A0AAW1CMV1_9HEMI